MQPFLFGCTQKIRRDLSSDGATRDRRWLGAFQTPHLGRFAERRRARFDARMADNRTISQLEAEGYPWIGCECCKGTVWVPFRMRRERIPMLSAMTLDQLGARMKCDRCGKRPERYYPANQRDTPGFVRRK
jgi:hypothetical protein